MKAHYFFALTIILLCCFSTHPGSAEEPRQTASYYLDKGDYFHDRGKIEEAHKEYLKSLNLLKSDDDKVKTFGRLTITYYEKQEYSNAYLYCKKILQIAPDNAWAKKRKELLHKQFNTTLNAKKQAKLKKPVSTKQESPDQMPVKVQFVEGKFFEQQKKYDKAFYWYKKAAEKNHMPSQIKTAQAYSKGRGVAKNEYESYRWYRKAAEQGSPYAALKVGDVFYKDKEYKHAARWYAYASSENNGSACEKLAKLYFYGVGVKKDHIKARILFEQAEKLDHTLDGVSNLLLGTIHFGSWNPDYYEAEKRFRTAYRKGIPEGLEFANNCKKFQRQERRREQRMSTGSISGQPSVGQVLAGIFAIGVVVKQIQDSNRVDVHETYDTSTDEGIKECIQFLWNSKRISYCITGLTVDGGGHVDVNCSPNSASCEYFVGMQQDLGHNYYCDREEPTHYQVDKLHLIREICTKRK